MATLEPFKQLVGCLNSCQVMHPVRIQNQMFTLTKKHLVAQYNNISTRQILSHISLSAHVLERVRPPLVLNAYFYKGGITYN